jgi:pantoate--beta-alanine ligase
MNGDTHKTVRVVTRAEEFSRFLDSERACGRSVGLVPTMGALHEGHTSLIERAAAECEVVAVTIFVNPLQFEDPSDLERYPRDLDGDLSKAGAGGAHIVFTPGVEEMYPGHPQPPATAVHVAGVSEGLEGSSRRGHFDGVATVVTKLFALAGRCRAYFGEKDFQQLAVVRALVRDLSLPIEVVVCPTVREPDGLAMSSRNRRLDSASRCAALCINRSLQAGRAVLEQGERDLDVVRGVMRAEMALEPSVECDYAEVVDPDTLKAPEEVTGSLRLLVAATVGGVRLIDNLAASVPPGPQVPAEATNGTSARKER